MAKVMILGSGFAVPDEVQDNTHLLVTQGDHTILVDTASNPILKLRRAGVAFDALTDLVLTHFHPDHVSGVPLLLMGMWLLGRKLPLDIYGLKHTIQRVQAMLDLYELLTWPNFYTVSFHVVADGELSPVIEQEDLRVFASPVRHLIPTMGLRFEFIPQAKVVAYSCDTEPCEEVVRLAHRADVLVHEAAGASIGHTSPQQAAEIARRAETQALYLIHYSQMNAALMKALDEARGIYPGPICLTQDFLPLDFG